MVRHLHAPLGVIAEAGGLCSFGSTTSITCDSPGLLDRTVTSGGTDGTTNRLFIYTMIVSNVNVSLLLFHSRPLG